MVDTPASRERELVMAMDDPADESELVSAAARTGGWSGPTTGAGFVLAAVAAIAQTLVVGWGIARPEGSGGLRQDLLQRLGNAFDGVGPVPAILFLVAAVLVAVPLIAEAPDARQHDANAAGALGLTIVGSIVAVAGGWLAFRSDINSVDQLGGGVAGWQLLRSGTNLALAAGVGLVGFAFALVSLRNRADADL
jgi:cytochrome bd-type quinol oxidase subunit 2